MPVRACRPRANNEVAWTDGSFAFHDARDDCRVGAAEADSVNGFCIKTYRSRSDP